MPEAFNIVIAVKSTLNRAVLFQEGPQPRSAQLSHGIDDLLLVVDLYVERLCGQYTFHDSSMCPRLELGISIDVKTCPRQRVTGSIYGQRSGTAVDGYQYVGVIA